MTRPHVWDDVLDDEIRAIASRYAGRQGLRSRPALLCIDNYNAVFGDRREPLLQAMQRYPSSCGPAAWDAVEPTQQLMEAARGAGIPIFHTTSERVEGGGDNLVVTKRRNEGSDPTWDFTTFAPLAPRPGEMVLRKGRASAFFGTPLTARLIERGIDTVLVCGNSTSGCVRATVLDASMLGFRVGVVEECVFDRAWLSHKVNLFDMHLKYADVLFLDEALAYLAGLSGAASASTADGAAADTDASASDGAADADADADADQAPRLSAATLFSARRTQTSTISRL